nr:MAG TPA: hypothetical protein [Caudoviricetes sp.]
MALKRKGRKLRYIHIKGRSNAPEEKEIKTWH